MTQTIFYRRLYHLYHIYHIYRVYHACRVCHTYRTYRVYRVCHTYRAYRAYCHTIIDIKSNDPTYDDDEVKENYPSNVQNDPDDNDPDGL